MESVMDHIIEPNNTFDFSKLTLAQPTSIPGGAYFTKILFEGKALYIQTPKCSTRQGFLKTGKKIHCDLMFDNNDTDFIHWVENLETKCQELIFQKSNEWFQSPLEYTDIETAFNSPLKVYKSGKFYLVRTNVKINSLSNQPIIKIYNENETPVPMDDIHAESSIISILEIQGIKFTTRNFQIEVELKQLMVLNKDIIFESCLIKKEPSTTTSFIPLEQKQEPEPEQEPEPDLVQDMDPVMDQEPEMEPEPTLEQEDLVNSILEDIAEPSNELMEVDVDFGNNLETISLKKPSDVYYTLYKEAREKAKLAKKEAVIAYLEAKNIKKTYMLEDMSESSDDSDIYDEP